jgi:uncharacterized protein
MATPSIGAAGIIAAMPVTLDDLRRHALARSLFPPTTLARAIARLGFVQADPLRAPARAQDLTLRHRVRGYRAGDLERRYARLAVEEDFFVNYGFVPRATQALMHPRRARIAWTPARWAQAQAVLDFVRARGVVHPREVDAQFRHGKTRNWFGGAGNASTELLDGMHYRGLLRVARREGGVRLYAARAPQGPHGPDGPQALHGPDGAGESFGTSGPCGSPIRTAERPASAVDPVAVLDSLADVVLRLYAPLPQASYTALLNALRSAVPQWSDRRREAAQRALARHPGAEVDGLRWVWPAGENPAARRHAVPEGVHLLAPFDPVVWDRRRFEIFWGWAYRFEAYTPAARRLRGHYALPLLWQGQVIGWGNLAVQAGRLQPDLGYVAGRPPRGAAWRAALDDELGRMSNFLGCG